MEFGDWFNMLALSILNGGFGLAGIFLNSLVILSFWKSTQLRRKLCYFLILVLAISDLIVVTIIHPLLFSFTVMWFTTKRLVFPFLFDPFFGFSMFTLLTMNLERYWAVRHPYFHQRSVTKRRLVVLLLFFWSFVLAMSLLSYQKAISSEIPGLTILGAIFLLILYINYKMFTIVRNIKQTDAVAMGYQMNTENAENRGKPDVKNISTCFLAIACFFVCSFPVLVLNGLKIAFNDGFGDDVRIPFLLWAQTFLSMNSTFNCLIFYWKTTALRREGRKLLGRCGIFETVSASVSV